MKSDFVILYKKYILKKPPVDEHIIKKEINLFMRHVIVIYTTM